MKNRTHKIFLFFSLFSFFITLHCLADASVPLSSYEARFEVIADVNDRLRDVLVELTLAYGDHDVSEINDMKIVEAAVIQDVAVTDGKGNQLEFAVKTNGKESTIRWKFPRVQGNSEVVIIRFILPDAVSTKEGRTIFGAYWVGGFIVPVERALYRFIFPPGYSFNECSVYPQYGYQEKIVDEKREVSVSLTQPMICSSGSKYLPNSAFDSRSLSLNSGCRVMSRSLRLPYSRILLRIQSMSFHLRPRSSSRVLRAISPLRAPV